jgi:formylglycine-generating enzyme required for sulfatase activity
VVREGVLVSTAAAAGTVFIAWDVGIPDLGLTVGDLVRDPATRDRVRALSTDDLEQGSIARKVREGIDRQARFVAFVDAANIQVGFELGYALGRGKIVSICRAGNALPDWLTLRPLAGCLAPCLSALDAGSDDVTELHALLFSCPGFAGPRRPTPGTRLLAVCLGDSPAAKLLRRKLKATLPQVTLLSPTDPPTFEALPDLLDGVGHVVLALPAPEHGPRKPDLATNVAAAVYAGLALGLDLKVTVLRSSAHRRLEDIEDLTHVFAGDDVGSLDAALRQVAEDAERAQAAAHSDAEQAYRGEQHAAHRRLLPPFLPTHEHLAVQHLHIDLDLVARRSPRELGPDAEMSLSRPEGKRGGAWQLADLLDPALSGGRAGRWLVFGEPGAGKSTSARHLAHVLTAPGEAPSTARPLPLFTSLNELVAAGGDPFALAANRLARENHVAAAGLAAVLRQRAQAGALVFLLDGLDELSTDAAVGRALEIIRRLGVDWPTCPLLVFTRHAGAQVLVDTRTGPGPADRPFLEAEIRPLSDPQQGEMLRMWLGDARGKDASDALGERPTLREVVRNPLLLALVGTLVLRGEELPPSRVSLYARAVEVLLGGEHRGRGLSADARAQLAADAERFDRISLLLQQSGAETYSSRQLEGVVAATGAAGAGDAETSDFIERVCIRSGLLARHDGGGQPWRYLHRSFREFMAARAMSRLEDPLAGVDFPTETGDDKADRKAWETFSGTWGEPLALLCGLLGAIRPERVAEVIERVAERGAEVAKRALLNADGLDPGLAVAAFCAAPFANDGDALRELALLHARRGPKFAENATNALWQQVRGQPELKRLAVLHWALTWVAVEGRQAAHPNDLQAVEPDRRRFFELAGRPTPPARAEDIGLRFSRVVGGDFTMGSPEGVGDQDEHPAHRVSISPLQAGVFTVTAAEFERLVRPDEWANRWKSPRHPATQVDWYTARLFGAWVGARLPTEAEWEFLCRARSDTAYFSGDAEADLRNVGWFAGNSERRVHPVGERPANTFGLHDTHGNVWEWCSDRMRPYDAAAVKDPSGRIDGARRAVRGGAYWDVADWCRSACRLGSVPGVAVDDLGFRLVRPAPSAHRP